MKKIRLALVILHFFVGLGALAGGLCAITDPYSPMGMSTATLAGSPFDSFLIPGLVLFGVIGLGDLAAGAMALAGRRRLGYSSGVMGCVLMGWIVVQCFMLKAVVALHVVFFGLGAAMACLALAELVYADLWPGTWVRKLLPGSARRT